VATFCALFYGLVFYGAFTELWGVNHAFTLDNSRYVFSTGSSYLINTLKLAGVATPIGGLLGIVIAYLVTRKTFPGRRVLDFLAMLNFAVPGIIVGIGYVFAFNTPRYNSFDIYFPAYACSYTGWCSNASTDWPCRRRCFC